MTTHDTRTASDDAPGPAGPGDPSAADASGPRVTRDEARDLSRLRRARHDRKIAGVAGGLARHLDIDPLIVRVVLVVLAFFGGAGLLVYGVCWLILPSEDADDALVTLDDRSRTVALLVVGALAALALLGDSLGGWEFPWPLAVVGLIVLGIYLVRGNRVERGAAPAGAPAAPGVPVPPPGMPAATVRVAQPTWRRGPVLFWYTLALITVVLGVLAMVQIGAGIDLPAATYPATALGLCGAMLVLGSFWGRPGGLIALGLLLALGTAAATVAEEVDAGSTRVRPATAAMLQDSYSQDLGELTLDLTAITDLETLDGREVDASVGLGRLVVVVPRGLDVVADAEVGLGGRRIFGDHLDGSGTTTWDGGAGAPRLTLDLKVDIGEITIERGRTTR